MSADFADYADSDQKKPDQKESRMEGIGKAETRPQQKDSGRDGYRETSRNREAEEHKQRQTRQTGFAERMAVCNQAAHSHAI